MRFCCIMLTLLLSIAAARGQAVTAPFARPLPAGQADKISKYNDELNRLAEILGSLHYLTNLCAPPAPRSAAAANMQWRNAMEQLITALHGDAEQTARLTAAFNRSYQAFADSYSKCAPSAREALARYKQAGQDLSGKILENFSGDSASGE